VQLSRCDAIGLDTVLLGVEGAHVFDEAAREESRLVACAAVIIVDKARRRPWRGQAVAWIANRARHSSRTAATCMLAFPWPFRVIFADPTRAVALPADYDQPDHLARSSAAYWPKHSRKGVSRVMEQGRLVCLIWIKLLRRFYLP
jgi:hypothetical protein